MVNLSPQDFTNVSNYSLSCLFDNASAACLVLDTFSLASSFPCCWFSISALDFDNRSTMIWLLFFKFSQEICLFKKGRSPKSLVEVIICWERSQVPNITIAYPQDASFNPLTPKFWFLILLSNYYTFLCISVTRIKYWIKTITSIWPVCWITHGYFRENLYVNHFWELKG